MEGAPRYFRVRTLTVYVHRVVPLLQFWRDEVFQAIWENEGYHTELFAVRHFTARTVARSARRRFSADREAVQELRRANGPPTLPKYQRPRRIPAMNPRRGIFG